MKQICKPGDEPFSPQAELSDQDIIVKIFTVNYGSRERGDLEVAALKCLTAGGCKHAPTYLGDFKKKLDGFPKGEIRYVLMSRLPGYSLADRETWNVNAHRRDRVEKAFGIAIRSVHSCHIHNSSPYLRNILWSPENEMCYIVDFERAELDVPPAEMPEEWSDFDWWAELGGQLD